MIVAHVITDLTPGGAELMLKRLIFASRGSDLQHVVISLRGLGTVGPELRRCGIRVETLGMSGFNVVAAFFRLISLLKAIRPDIVQTWMYHADLMGGLAARAISIRRIIWGVRVSDITSGMGISRPTFLIRRICSLLSALVPARIVYVANSAMVTHERLGYDRTKSVFIPNGYQVPAEEALRKARRQVRRELGLAEETVLIGSAGRFSAQKDHPTFIRAATLLATGNPEVRFLLAGRGLDSGNSQLVGWIDQAGLTERFLLLGPRRNLMDYLAALDIFCLHSVGEGFPNVVAEAMSAAVPCVVTDVGDAAFLVGDTGSVVPPADPERLAEALAAMSGAGPVHRTCLGRRARSRVAEHFSMDKISGQYEELYRTMVSQQVGTLAGAAIQKSVTTGPLNGEDV